MCLWMREEIISNKGDKLLKNTRIANTGTVTTGVEAECPRKKQVWERFPPLLTLHPPPQAEILISWRRVGLWPIKGQEAHWGAGQQEATWGTGEPESCPQRRYGPTCQGPPAGVPLNSENLAGVPAKLARKPPAGVVLNYLGSQQRYPQDWKLPPKLTGVWRRLGFPHPN